MSYENYRGCGAIICKHISDEKLPILRATRDEPLEPEDSGWQFICGIHKHETADAALWSLEEVAQLDPSLLTILDAEPGTSFQRAIRDAPWQRVTYAST
jgi:hypothetical protein